MLSKDGSNSDLLEVDAAACPIHTPSQWAGRTAAEMRSIEIHSATARRCCSRGNEKNEAKGNKHSAVSYKKCDSERT